MGIGIRNLSAAAEVESEITNFADALRQTAAGLLGTTVQLADLVRPIPNMHAGDADRDLAAGNPFCRRRVHVHRRGGGIAHVRQAPVPLFPFSSARARVAPCLMMHTRLTDCWRIAKAASKRYAR